VPLASLSFGPEVSKRELEASKRKLADSMGFYLAAVDDQLCHPDD